MQSMKIVSLFSGAGGLDLGLIQAGHQVIWANDIDPDAVRTYKENIGKHAVLADIGALSNAELPKADVVVGGFPCQGFSLANLKRSGDDSRNTLYLQFLRVISVTKPRYFLAENVRGILSLDHGRAIEKIVLDFTEAGYRVRFKLFNVADYGIPQSRMRVIIAGTREDLPDVADFEFPKKTHTKKPTEQLKSWRTITDGIAGIPDPIVYPNALPNQTFSKYKVTNRNFTGHRKTDPNKPAPTILARGNGGGGVCAIQHPENLRRLSVRESAAIQTFPHDFVFFGSMNSQYRQVGNAVPVEFGAILGTCLNEAEAKRVKAAKRITK
jgi:DNA (cytosine-5)-methyltransferase 1